MELAEPVTSMRMGAPMAICKALAPTILAFSNRVIRGGPIKILLRIIYSSVQTFP